MVLMLAMGMLGVVVWKRFYMGGGSHAS
ncbi:MAG: hypothetical protein LDL14_07095 [Nitrospira sp.]|nr:hypothetical protein [Nitrospira sp.]